MMFSAMPSSRGAASGSSSESAARQRGVSVASRFSSGGALVALAAMTAVAIYAFSQRAEARQRGREAQARALVAEAQVDARRAPELSLLLALKAAGIERSNDVESVLRRALEASRLRAVRKTSDTAPAPWPPHAGLRVGGKPLPEGNR